MTPETPPSEEPGRAPEATDPVVGELQRAIQARDEFLSTVAHELRNAMTPIVMQVQALLNSARRGDETWRETTALPRLERLQVAADSYVRRATMLLDLSRLTTGHHQLEWTEFDLSARLRETVREQEPLAEFAGSSITSDIQGEIVGTLDPLAFERVAANLISNAIKYGDGKPVHVSLTAQCGTARLAVRDQGIGISAEDQARIFGQFERAARRRDRGGFGIGLWLVSRFVNAMRGGIAVESRPGEGSVFTVTLPLRPVGEGGPT